MLFCRLPNVFCSFQKATALHLGIMPLLMLHLFYGPFCHQLLELVAALPFLRSKFTHFFLGKLSVCWNSSESLALLNILILI